MFTGIFRVKGGGRLKAITFCFLTVVFSVVVALLGVFRRRENNKNWEEDEENQ